MKLGGYVKNGCDSHIHIIGQQTVYPMVAERRYTPGIATIESLHTHLQGQGLERAVIIQPSVYGFDNRCTLDALEAMQNKARAVLVLPSSTTNAELKVFDAQGARGIRLNVESTGALSVADLAAQLQFWGARLADIGWHIQVYAPMLALAACADVIAKLPVPVVLDHFALWTDVDCKTDAAHQLIELLESGRIYIKLSASYRQPTQSAEGLASLVHRFLFLRPDRLLWGSDWPHTQREAGKSPTEVSAFRAIPVSSMLPERLAWLDGADWQQQVLVDNPAKLYGF